MRHGRKKESKPLPTRPVPTNLTTSPRVHGGRAGAGGVVAVRTPKDRIESTVRFFAARRDAWCKHSLLLVSKESEDEKSIWNSKFKSDPKFGKLRPTGDF